MKSAKNEEYKCFLPSESDETIAQEQNPGGQGWWRYEFCYGKHVKQYHEYPQENGKAKKPNDEVFVGKWDETVHLKYAEGKNVVKKSMTKVKQAST